MKYEDREDKGAVDREFKAGFSKRKVSLPFAIMRQPDGIVLGSTRFRNLEGWA
jgi:hypothetical protein